MKRFLQQRLGVVLAVVFTLGVGFLLLFRTFPGIISLSYDIPYAFLPREPVNEVIMIYMDDDSHRMLKQPFDKPWDRAETHAKLLNRLAKEGAKAAVLDIVFRDNSADPEKDATFAKAIKEFGKVVLAADVTHGATGRIGTGRDDQITLPIELLMNEAAAIGKAQLTPDQDLVPRKHPFINTNDFIHPMSVAALELLQPGSLADLVSDRTRWIRYYGPPVQLPNVSYYRTIPHAQEDYNDTNKSTAPVIIPSDLPIGYFSNKVVFIGSKLITKTQGERKDEYPSPYTRWLFGDVSMFMPGVEIQATLFLNLLRKQWFTQFTSTQELLIMLIIGLASSIGLIKMRPFWATVTAFTAVLLIAVIAYLLVANFGCWFAWLIIVVQILVALAWSTIYNSITLYVQKRLMQQSLSMYVSPGQVKQIMKQPDILKPGATKQQVSILFSDIAGFTTMSEGMDSDDLAKLMNSYFEAAVGKCIHKTEGTVVKFIGDAIFAIWNAPEKQEDHADRACGGAILLRDQIGDFIGGKGKAIRTRIGLHMGDANVGNFGSSTRIDYTAIGENINLASRMEGLNKYMGTDILITGDVKAAVGERFITRLCGLVRLKGFEKKAVAVHELINVPEKAEETRVWREAYTAAWEQFKMKNFAGAKEGFRKVLDMKPNDGPSQFHLNFLEEVKLDELPENWQGEIEMHEK